MLNLRADFCATGDFFREFLPFSLSWSTFSVFQKSFIHASSRYTFFFLHSSPGDIYWEQATQIFAHFITTLMIMMMICNRILSVSILSICTYLSDYSFINLHICYSLYLLLHFCCRRVYVWYNFIFLFLFLLASIHQILCLLLCSGIFISCMFLLKFYCVFLKFQLFSYI